MTTKPPFSMIDTADGLNSTTYHRHVLQQGDDLTGQDPKVVAQAQAAWGV